MIHAPKPQRGGNDDNQNNRNPYYGRPLKRQESDTASSEKSAKTISGQSDITDELPNQPQNPRPRGGLRTNADAFEPTHDSQATIRKFKKDHDV